MGFFMYIYQDGSGLFFFNYSAKRLFHDSVTRTSDGSRAFCQGSYFEGVANILLARIESAGAFLLCFLPAIPFIALEIVCTPVFLIVATVLNLASRVPGISSFETVNNFTTESEDAIFRTLWLSLIAIPVIFLFLSGAAINVIPWILGEENIFFTSINWLVESLGPLKSICAVVNESRFAGTMDRVSALTTAEEGLRALSTKNYLKEIRCEHVFVMTA